MNKTRQSTSNNLSVESIWGMDTQQSLFRELMDAISRPGSIKKLNGLLNDTPAHRGVLATLLDNEVSLADPHLMLDKNDWPLLQVKESTTEQADYILCNGKKTSDFEPKLGTLPSPDHSATLIIIVAKLGSGNTQLRLTGPGVDKEMIRSLDGLHSSWLDQRKNWNAAFPLGVDIIFTDANQIMALPRTTLLQQY